MSLWKGTGKSMYCHVSWDMAIVRVCITRLLTKWYVNEFILSCVFGDGTCTCTNTNLYQHLSWEMIHVLVRVCLGRLCLLHTVKSTVRRMNTPALISFFPLDNTLYFPVYGLYCYF